MRRPAEYSGDQLETRESVTQTVGSGIGVEVVGNGIGVTGGAVMYGIGEADGLALGVGVV